MRRNTARTVTFKINNSMGNKIEMKGSKENQDALNIAFFLGAIAMLDIFFRDEVDDESKHRRYVMDLCESNAPDVPMDVVNEYILGKLTGESRSWVNDWYVRRRMMS